MGHIQLAAPVVHIWYLRGTRSWLAYLLMGTEPKEELKAKQLEKVIYFAANLVTYVDEEQAATRTSPSSRARCATSSPRSTRQTGRDEERRLKELEAELLELEDQGAQGRRRPRPAACEREGHRGDPRARPGGRSTSPSGRSTSSSRSTPARSSRTRRSGARWRSATRSTSRAAWAPTRSCNLLDRIDLDDEERKLREQIEAADGRKPLSARSAARRRSSGSAS